MGLYSNIAKKRARIKAGKAESASTKLHSVMLEAKRIRMAHSAGQLSAEEAAKKLAELYHVHRFKSHRKEKG